MQHSCYWQRSIGRETCSDCQLTGDAIRVPHVEPVTEARRAASTGRTLCWVANSAPGPGGPLISRDAGVGYSQPHGQCTARSEAFYLGATP